MHVPTTRRGILIGSLSSAAFPLTVSAHDLFKSPGELAPAFDSAIVHQTGFSVPMERLKWLDVKIEAYDENGIGQTGTGYVYEHTHSTVIAAEQAMLRDAKSVFVTFTQRDAGGRADAVQETRMEVAGFSPAQVEPINAHSKLAVVAQGDWHRRGDEWHLRIA